MSMVYDEAELVPNNFETEEPSDRRSPALVTPSPSKGPSKAPTNVEPTTSPTIYSPTLLPSQGPSTSKPSDIGPVLRNSLGFLYPINGYSHL